MKICVLGTGSWGTALAQVLADNKQEVIMWGIDPREVEDIEVNHHNTKFFETEINHDIHASTDLSVVADADVVLAAVPTMAIEEVLTKASQHLTKPAIIINVAKGFHPVTHERLSVVISKIVPAEKCAAIVSLIGPSHAEEVIQRLMTSVNAVSDNEEAAKAVQHLFSNQYFRVS